MEKIKQSITQKIQDLGESFTSNDEDARMEDMSEYILSPYAGSKSMESIAAAKQKAQTRSLPTTDPSNDKDVMDSIDAAYFIEHDFDAIQYELRKQIDADICVNDLERERLRLKAQLQVVSKKVSLLIMEKSPSYSGHLENMDEIRNGLTGMLQEVRKIRGALGLAKRRSGTALGILANEKKKKMLFRLRSTLLTIKTLYETEYQLNEAIESANFPLAIRICIEAKEAATTYKQFNCVSDLMAKMVGTTNLIENELNSALSSLTLVFDLDKYAFVYNAYSMLGKVEPGSRKLVQHFVSTIDTSSRAVVEEKVGSPDETKDISYEGLCEALPSDMLVNSIRELCFVLCKVLSLYHTILRYHTEEHERCQVESAAAAPGIMLSFLTSSMYTVFRAALSKVNSLVCCQDFSGLKFDNIMEIVDMCNRFRRLGRTHFGHSSGELALALEKQILSYFVRYYSERMEEVRMFLENESFTLCPVPYQFTIFDLQDFQFLKEAPEERLDTDIASAEGLGELLDFSLMPAEYVNPFGKEEVKSRHVSEYSASSSVDQDAAEEQDAVSEEDHIPPNLCNTALNLLRLFGRYIRMTSLLPSVAEKSIPSVTQLFEFFFYSVCHLFAEDGSDMMECPARIMNVLDDIGERMIRKNDREEPDGCVLVSPPSLCCAVQLSFPDQLFGAAERIVAMESLEFVARQLDLVRPVIETLIDPSNTKLLATLDTFYSEILSVVPTSRLLIVDSIASRALKLPVLLQSISSSKWDIDELRSQHSQYIDFMLQDFAGFKLRLDTVAEAVHVSPSLRTLFWDRVIYYAFRTLVQGYCEGGRCTTEGRALMQLDFQHLQLKLEPICGMKPIPHTAYVDGFIKAFYLPESGLETWINQHKEYTSKQMISLLGVATHVSKKAKTRIISALAD